MAAPQDRPPIAIPVPPDRVVTAPDRLRWATVSTIRAPLDAIARFAAWHLDLGAETIHVYLDRPDPATEAFFEPHAAVRLTICDAAWWRDKPRAPLKSHRLRQAFNASHCYRRATVDWLAHLDVDEFLLPSRPLADMLAEVPADAACARVAPAEMLAQPDPWNGPVHFKRTRRAAGHSRAVLEEVYPEIGAWLPEGFLSYTGAKVIARTGLDGIRFGIHTLWHQGRQVANAADLTGASVGHAHAPSWEVFERHLGFRLTEGSYQKKSPDSMELKDIVDMLLAEGGTPALRRFYDAVNSADPALVARLAAHDMLVTARLDLDDRVSRRFGPLPEPEAGA